MEGLSQPFNTDNTLEIQRLQLALESAGLGTWELDSTTHQFRWCHRAKNLFSFSGSDRIDFKVLLDLIHPEDRDAFRDKISEVLLEDETFSFSTEIRTAQRHEGKTRWLICKGQSHRDPVTGSMRLLGTLIDSTLEVENRALLSEKQRYAQSFQTIVEQAPLVIGLLRGPEFIIELGNDKIFEVWGKSAEITGMRLEDALPEIKGQGFLELLTAVYTSGIPYVGNGSVVSLEREGQMQQVYFDFVYSPLREPDGEISGVMIMASEVTRQHMALKELEASEARFRALIEQAPVAICLFVGEDMVIELANQPMIGYWRKDESVIGKPLREAVPELAGQPFVDILDQIRATGKAYNSKSAAVDIEVDGKRCTSYFNFTYKPIFDSDGNIYGIINMSIDVTAQVLAQKALEESESKLRTVIASAPAAIGLFVGRDLVVELPNQAFIDIVGKGPDITGKPLSEVMPELESQPFLQILDDVYTTGVTYKSFGTQVNIVQHGVMTSNYYDITYSPVYDSQGKVYAILDIAVDVTERVSVEKQIQESQLQLLSLFEHSPVGIAMLSREDLTFTMANPFYCKLVGKEQNQIIGKPLMQAIPEMEGQGFENHLQSVIDTGIPFHVKEQAMDIRYGDQAQTVYLNLAYQPQRDPEGNIVGVLVLATDLTEPVLIRKKIEETQAFLRGAIELAQLGTYSIDLTTGIMDYSDRLKHWFGFEKEEQITSQMVYEAICKEDLPGVISAVDQAITPGSSGLFDMEYTTDAEKTGVARILHSQGKVLFNESDKPVSIIGTVQDVTVQRKINLALESQVQERTEELKSINEELATINEEYIATNEELSELNNMLQQSNLNLQQFAYVASHDLQEPLRKIQSFSNLLASRYGDSLGDGVNYLQRMQSAAKRMSELIKDLLAFSRITTQNEIMGTVALNKIVHDVLNDLELVISESSASVTIENLPEIQGDPVQLNQLFLNLISNALKFRKPDLLPVIEVTSTVVPGVDLPSSVNVTRATATYYKISVTDNGIGFDQQYADRIFQLFQRLHGRNQYSGTGIGLAICERVAANHGGGISATGQPGLGARFDVFLPVD
jgi:PAS domain S-box-containing protein